MPNIDIIPEFEAASPSGPSVQMSYRSNHLYNPMEASASLAIVFEQNDKPSKKGSAQKRTESSSGFQTQDYLDLQDYFKVNKYFVNEQDKIYLEQYVVKGFPT